MLILKFGGSVLKEASQVLKIIREELKVHKKLIIITSAIGRYPDPYATDTLLLRGKNLEQSDLAELVSCGEIISGTSLVNYLRKNRINAVFKSVYDLNLTFDNDLHLQKELFLDHEVTVIPGFIALKQGRLFLLPRGGSNLTAVFFADYFRCNLMIISDTDGIYEHNPQEKLSVKLSVVSIASLATIIMESPRIFPFEVIKYLKRETFVILYRNLESKNGSLIGNFFKNALLK